MLTSSVEMANEIFYDISSVEACLLSSLLSVIFVASLYVWALCGYSVSDRNNSLVIKQRIISVTFVCVLAPIIVCCYCRLLLWNDQIVTNRLMILASYEFWTSIGVNFDNLLISLFYTLLLMIILFLGPLVENPNHFKDLGRTQYSSSLLIIRGLLVGPICEEWVYRGCCVSLLFHGNIPYWLCIMIPPLLFSMSHAHHFYYQLSQLGGSKSTACLRVIFQLFYTSVFGVLASIIFIRTGNVFSAMLMHIWCNCMGFPRFAFVQNYKAPKMRDIVNGIAYVCGLIGFIVLLYPLTNPRYFGSPFQS